MNCTVASTLVIGCGALASELTALRRANRWAHWRVKCLPANLHNRPDDIPAAVLSVIEANRTRFDNIVVAYADCGTGGRLDAVLAPYGIERLRGAHCYEVFAGSKAFHAMQAAEPGTFYLTDFLARHFDRLVMDGLGLHRHPELRDAYFGNYSRIVFLSQTESPALDAMARDAADKLGLAFERRASGLSGLDATLRRLPGVVPIRWSEHPASDSATA